MSIIRVLVADKVEMTKSTLLRNNGVLIEVVGESDDGHEALRLVQTTRPDIAIFAENLHSLDGLSAAEQLHMLQPDIGLLLIVDQEDEERKTRAVNIGVNYHLHRSLVEKDLTSAIKDVADQMRAKNLL